MIQIPKEAEHHIQGDVIFYKLFEMPSQVAITKKRKGIILEGEATGHNHELKSNGQVLLLDRAKEERGHHALLQLEYADEVIHHEHQSVRLGTGVWLVVRQRQFGNIAISD